MAQRAVDFMSVSSKHQALPSHRTTLPSIYYSKPFCIMQSHICLVFTWLKACLGSCGTEENDYQSISRAPGFRARCGVEEISQSLYVESWNGMDSCAILGLTKIVLVGVITEIVEGNDGCVGRDSKKGIFFPSWGLTISCLLAVTCRIAFHVYYPQTAGSLSL